MIFDHLRREFVYALRVLIKTPLVTVAVIGSLALGAGANIAFFAATNAVLLRSLPVDRPEQLVIIKRTTPEGPEEEFPYSIFEHVRDNARTLAGACGWSTASVSVRIDNRIERLRAELVTDEYFRVLSIRPVRGRLPDPSSADQLVISHRYWIDRLGGQDSAIGMSLFINSIPFTIAAVAPPGFDGLEVGVAKDLWLPISLAPTINRRPDLLESDSLWWIFLLGRLGPGVAAPESQSELTGLFQSYRLHARGTTLTPEAEQEIRNETVSLGDGRRGVSRLRENRVQSLYWLTAAAITSLLIVCTNVGSMLTARLGQRRRDLAIRASLGASRSTIVRQLITESAVLSFFAVIGGLLISKWALPLLPGMVFGGVVRIDASPDWRAYLFAASLMIAGTVLFGASASWSVSYKTILDNVRPYSATIGPSRSGLRRSARHLPLFLQITLSMVLVLQTGLFAKTLLNLTGQELGFESDNLILFQVDPSQAGYSGSSFVPFQNEFMERVRALPGVESASYSRSMPMTSAQLVASSIKTEGYSEPIKAEIQLVDPGFFRTMGISLAEGSDFSAGPGGSDSLVPVVVNQAFTRRYFEGVVVLGKQLQLSESALLITGVAIDGKYHNHRETAAPLLYAPYLRWPSEAWGPMTVLVRMQAQAQSALRDIEAGVRRMNPGVPIYQARTMTSHLDDLLVQERSLVNITGLMALLALLLVAIGTYGLVAQFVNGRMREIAIRLALGARHSFVIWLCYRSIALVTVAGLLIGYLAANAFGRLTASLQFGASSEESLLLMGCAGTIVLAATLGASIPLVKVIRLNPVTLLRTE